jgi:hypothetical protein
MINMPKKFVSKSIFTGNNYIGSSKSVKIVKPVMNNPSLKIYKIGFFTITLKDANNSAIKDIIVETLGLGLILIEAICILLSSIISNNFKSEIKVKKLVSHKTDTAKNEVNFDTASGLAYTTYNGVNYIIATSLREDSRTEENGVISIVYDKDISHYTVEYVSEKIKGI